MSKFKIRAELDGVAKLLELDRGTQLEVSELKAKIEKLFAVKSVDMRYQFSDGRVQAIYQDFHLQQAIQDCETSRKTKALTILLKSSDPQRQPAVQAASATSTQSSAPTKTHPPSKTPATTTSASSANSSASGAVKFCDNCGSKLSSTSRFCSGCGASSTGGSAPAQSAPSTGGQNTGNNCAGCNQPINGQGVRALDKPWHKDCFCCNLCKKSLLNGSFMDDDNGKPLCLSCFENNYAQKCAKCNKPIDGAYVSVEGKDFHKSCFVCETCGGSFDGGYFNKGGHSLCRKCI